MSGPSPLSVTTFEKSEIIGQEVDYLREQLAEAMLRISALENHAVEISFVLAQYVEELEGARDDD